MSTKKVKKPVIAVVFLAFSLFIGVIFIDAGSITASNFESGPLVLREKVVQIETKLRPQESQFHTEPEGWPSIVTIIEKKRKITALKTQR